MNLINLDHLSAEQRLRQLGSLVRDQLKLPLPETVTRALARVGRASALNAEYTGLAHQARAERAEAVAELIDGRTDLGAAVEVFAITGAMTSGSTVADRAAPVALAVLEEATRTAGLQCADALATSAGPIFDALRTECRAVVSTIENLPAPPRGLWGHADPLRLLVRSDGHEATLSVLSRANDRFELCHQAAEYVREPAGAGIQHFEDGSSHSVLAYRDWRRFAEIEADLAVTRSELRLWRSVVDGAEPGLWRPEDVPKLKAKEKTFNSILQRTGFATG